MKRIIILLIMCASVSLHPENQQAESFVIEKRTAASMKEYRANCATDLADLLKKMIEVDGRKSTMQGMIVDTLFDMAQNGKAFAKAKRSDYDACHATIKRIEYLCEQLTKEYGALEALLTQQNR